MIINIRGTNGSGKTHLARQLIGPNPNFLDLVNYQTQLKAGGFRQKFVEGWGGESDFLAIGSYKQGCGGMDTIPSFALQQQAVAVAETWIKNGKPITGDRPRYIVAEGVLASTVAGSWLEFFSRLKAEGHDILIAYLDTPLELCLERITARQIAAKGEAREIKTDQVAAKIKAINATRARFNDAGIPTWTLRHDHAHEDLMARITDEDYHA